MNEWRGLGATTEELEKYGLYMLSLRRKPPITGFISGHAAVKLCNMSICGLHPGDNGLMHYYVMHLPWKERRPFAV